MKCIIYTANINEHKENTAIKQKIQQKAKKKKKQQKQTTLMDKKQDRTINRPENGWVFATVGPITKEVFHFMDLLACRFFGEKTLSVSSFWGMTLPNMTPPITKYPTTDEIYNRKHILVCLPNKTQEEQLLLYNRVQKKRIIWLPSSLQLQCKRTEQALLQYMIDSREVTQPTAMQMIHTFKKAEQLGALDIMFADYVEFFRTGYVLSKEKFVQLGDAAKYMERMKTPFEALSSFHIIQNSALVAPTIPTDKSHWNVYFEFLFRMISENNEIRNLTIHTVMEEYQNGLTEIENEFKQVKKELEHVVDSKLKAAMSLLIDDNNKQFQKMTTEQDHKVEQHKIEEMKIIGQELSKIAQGQPIDHENIMVGVCLPPEPNQASLFIKSICQLKKRLGKRYKFILFFYVPKNNTDDFLTMIGKSVFGDDDAIEELWRLDKSSLQYYTARCFDCIIHYQQKEANLFKTVYPELTVFTAILPSSSSSSFAPTYVSSSSSSSSCSSFAPASVSSSAPKTISSHFSVSVSEYWNGVKIADFQTVKHLARIDGGQLYSMYEHFGVLWLKTFFTHTVITSKKPKRSNK